VETRRTAPVLTIVIRFNSQEKSEQNGLIFQAVLFFSASAFLTNSFIARAPPDRYYFQRTDVLLF
jgi:hypothetical protein